ncbi:MAG TPA: phosphotransferase [Chloroflexota bacterium]|nr:phosphotransferase [Chloroflexota bacterium]
MAESAEAVAAPGEPPDSLIAIARGHLARLGLMSPGACSSWRLLAGGVSNWVIRFEVGEGVVVKQALAQLRVPEEWLADPRRAVLEGQAMATLGARLPEGDLPRVLFVDEDACLLGMTSASEQAVPWKQLLLLGDADRRDAAAVGALLGRMHGAGWDDPRLAARYGDLDLFEQLRLAPYHEHAARVAELRGEQWLAGALRAGARAMRENRRTLAHGDFSPKNLLVHNHAVTALDFEVVHWGNPDFDTAFLITHLTLKAIHVPAAVARYAACARAFLDAYTLVLGRRPADTVDEGALRQAGSLLLARADGKSPAEYLSLGGLSRARALGTAVLRGEVGAISDLFFFQEER